MIKPSALTAFLRGLGFWYIAGKDYRRYGRGHLRVTIRESECIYWYKGREPVIFPADLPSLVKAYQIMMAERPNVVTLGPPIYTAVDNYTCFAFWGEDWKTRIRQHNETQTDH